MNDLALFLAGVCVTVIWSAAILLQLWAAYEGGKTEEKRKQAADDQSLD